MHGGRPLRLPARATDLFHPAANGQRGSVLRTHSWQAGEKHSGCFRVLDTNVPVIDRRSIWLFVEVSVGAGSAFITLCDGRTKKARSDELNLRLSYYCIERKGKRYCVPADEPRTVYLWTLSCQPKEGAGRYNFDIVMLSGDNENHRLIA